MPRVAKTIPKSDLFVSADMKRRHSRSAARDRTNRSRVRKVERNTSSSGDSETGIQGVNFLTATVAVELTPTPLAKGLSLWIHPPTSHCERRPTMEVAVVVLSAHTSCSHGTRQREVEVRSIDRTQKGDHRIVPPHPLEVMPECLPEGL